METVALVLGGGLGTRLSPMTSYTSKQLLHVYDKPMISYPLSIARLAGVSKIGLICRSDHVSLYKNFINGSGITSNVSYIIQDEPKGIAHALMEGMSFIDNKNVLMILGDNIIFGDRLGERVSSVIKQKKSTIFFHKVKDPSGLGVGVFSPEGDLMRLIEKPNKFISNWASIGLYFYSADDLKYLKKLVPSQRGELEITDFNTVLHEEGRLNTVRLGRGYAWFDNGTPDRILEAATFIQTLQNIQGEKIGEI